ncbi:MAG TPA: IS110 family transposase [Candidatus Limnocylindria bacterium]|nr:IS110 family transposase [Candidatus Limnocylindria bacterium]
MIWIGVDAHKRIHQAVAIDERGIVGERGIATAAQAWAELLAWARQWPERIWAVEGASYLGRGLAQDLAGGGERVREVSGRVTARRRAGMVRRGKSDRLDAHAVAVVLREEQDRLPRVFADDEETAWVQLWSRTQAELTKDMTRLVNRLHDLLLLCDPEYQTKLPALTTKAGIAAARTYVAPGTGTLARERERVIRQTAEQLALRDAQDRELRAPLERASRSTFRALRQIEGVGALISCAIVAEVGRPRAGFGEEQLAALAGVSPLEASSAGGPRHRLNRGGNRRLTMLFHQIVLTQARMYAPAQAYLARRRGEGRTAREARRALKRLIVRRVFHALSDRFAASLERVAA